MAGLSLWPGYGTATILPDLQQHAAMCYAFYLCAAHIAQVCIQCMAFALAQWQGKPLMRQRCRTGKDPSVCKAIRQGCNGV